MKSNLHRCRLGKRVATISMAWRAETPCGAFGFGHCGWNGKLAAVTNANGFVTAYAYDVMDRLASDGGITYTYDAAGNRMTKTENGETVVYTLGEGDRRASYGRARSPSAPQSVDVCGAYSYDEAGCVTRMERNGGPTLDLVWNGHYQLVSVSTNGVFAEGYAYDAWGNVTDGEVSVPALAALRYRFQGREWSAATGLINFRMRWYDSVTGRWLSKDPIGLCGGLNLYAFCSNNPICRIDVYGTLSSAFWAPQEIGFGSQQVVTHFSASAQTSLKVDDWVMTGGNTCRNWLMAGGPEKVGVWGAAFTTTVTKATLQWPSGWEWVKGLMGQRIIR